MSEAPHTPLHTSSHMSPAQAAQVVNVSRWTIMRALKSLELPAIRDNRNRWQIARKDLEAWRSHSVHRQQDSHTSHTPEALELAAAKAEIGQLRERLAALDTEAERWRVMAEKLATRPRRWWPWVR